MHHPSIAAIQLGYLIKYLITAIVLVIPAVAQASCGQASCSVDSRLSEIAPTQPWQLRLGFETEYIEQDQPWVRYHSSSVGSIPRPDHNEVDTTNLTWRMFVELGLPKGWSLGLMLPVAYRDHLHLEAPHDEARDTDEESDGEVTIGDATGTPERWNFTRLGDLQLTAAYSLLGDNLTNTSITLFAGLKLPTGSTNARNDDGELAEITLQAGTDSVDPIVGARLRHQLSLFDAVQVPTSSSVIVRTEGTHGKYGYRPGTEATVSFATWYPLWRQLKPSLQINFRYRDRDHVGNAEGVPKEHTGGEALYLSPGLLIDLTDTLFFQAYVQVPVLQRVNGIQLVSEWNLIAALSYRLELT